MSKFQITVHLDNGGIAGHMYVQLSNGRNNYYYGFNPKNSPSVYGKGVVNPDSPGSRIGDYNATNIESRTFDLTESQYDSAKKKADYIDAFPGDYDAFRFNGDGRNCVSFANEIASEAGIKGGIGNYFTDEQLRISEAGKYANVYYGNGSLWSELWESIKDLWDELNRKPDDDMSDGVGEIWNKPSPIALDINKSGKIETTPVANSKTYFDIDNDNFSERVEWLTGDDGWLARDLNANGKIDNQNELFGDGGGLKAYQKLAALNTNNTGTSANVINSADSAWNSLRVWIDTNSNGVSEAAELKTLASLGITSLSLETAPNSLKSTFVMNGVTYNAQDIFVATNQMDSWYKGTSAEITPLSLTLPMSRGYGDVKSMHYAASSSSALTTKLQALDNLPISGLDSYHTKLVELVEEWTGASSVASNSITSLIDSRHIVIMEKFSGMGAGSYIKNLNLLSSADRYYDLENLEVGYDKLMSELSVRFITQGTLANVFGNPSYSFADDEMKFSISHTEILANAKANSPTDLADKNAYWSEVSRALLSHADDFGVSNADMKNLINQQAGFNVEVRSYLADSILGGSGNDTIMVGSGNDTVWGWTGNDLIYGGAGNDLIGGDQDNDTIYGDDGNDSLFGWTGSDSLLGGAGNDYISGEDDNDNINGGEGADFLYGNNGYDTIIGGIGSDLIYGGDGNDSISDSATSSASIDNNTIYGEAGNDRIENNSNSAQLYGGIGNDTISGVGATSQTIYGGEGDDSITYNGKATVIYGDSGNDTISSVYGSTTDNTTVSGGLGNDVINGSTGKEIIRYARGDGDDVIKKATTTTTADVLELTNIARSGVTFSAVNNFSSFNDPNSVRINITGGGSILLENYLDGTNSGRIASVKFSDGVILNTAQISGAASAISGTAANDTIAGGAANDVIIGHAGADSLSGAAGNDSIYGGAGANSLRGGLGNDLLKGGQDSDTYFYAKGDGNDVIVDFVYSALQGVLRLENITRSESSFASVDTNADGTADSIRLNVNGGGSITLQDQLNANGGIDFFNIRFSDGTIMTSAQIKAAIPTPTTPSITGTSGDDTLYGDSGNNNIAGLGGNDQIIASDGNDSLSGDAGNDTIWGDGGNDTINGGDGIDQLIGGIGADSLNGGGGNDVINGDDGNDTIIGGVGVDYLVGGNGADRFVFNKGDTGLGNNGDSIADFNRSQGDKIALLGYGLGASGFKGTGAMAAGGAIEFNYSKVAQYNYTIIRIDADNNGASDQEIWLTGTQIDLTASDFQFV